MDLFSSFSKAEQSFGSAQRKTRVSPKLRPFNSTTLSCRHSACTGLISTKIFPFVGSLKAITASTLRNKSINQRPTAYGIGMMPWERASARSIHW